MAVAGSISTSSTNGETIVKWNGKEVFRDKVDGGVKSKASDADGKEMAAVVSKDGKVLWESEAGAAAALDLIELPEDLLADNKGIKVQSSDGETIVTFRGKQVWKGKAKNKVAGKVKEVGGVTYAAAFDGKKVLWENVRGAAKRVGGAPIK